MYLLCTKPCFGIDDGKSNITVGKIYKIDFECGDYFVIIDDLGCDHMFSPIGNDWDSEPDYFEKLEDISYQNFYKKFRGKCKEECEKLLEEFPNELKLVRGWYHEPSWPNKEPHWWLEDNNGKIHDPTALQFPSKGEEYFHPNFPNKIGFYEAFDGFTNCENCGKKIAEKDFVMQGNYPCCSNRCAMRLVGL
jgi:hypothetical protein